MTNKSPPKIDSRTATDIVQQVKTLLRVYTSGWEDDPINPGTGKPDGISTALINIFARYAEIIIERLNQVPDKNFLAFLNLLGASRLPPQPARAPLTFSLASGSAVDAIVPAGTQVAAPPAEGKKDPIIFETERELVVAATQLESFWVSDPHQDQYGDFSTLTKVSDRSEPILIFRGNQSDPHVFYLGHRILLGFSTITTLTLDVTLNPITTSADERVLRWEFWDGTQWIEKVPSSDGTNNLREPSGTIEFDLSDIDQGIPTCLISSIENRWLRCQLLTPIARTEPAEIFQNTAHSGMVRENHLPQIHEIAMTVELKRPLDQANIRAEGLLPEFAFANTAPVAIGQPFFPFGETPKFNDALYLAHAEAFSKDATLADSAAQITLAIDLENPWWNTAIARRVHPDYDLQLSWECWNGTVWEEVGMTQVPDWWHLIELNPLPSVIPPPSPPSAGAVPTIPSVTIQGTAKQGAMITINRRSETGAGQSLPALLREDGRFATAISLLGGINIITCTARYQAKENKAWLVVFQEIDPNNGENFYLEVTSPLIVAAGQTSVTLDVAVTEPVGQRSVNSIRVTNGRTNILVSEPKDSNESTHVLVNLETGFNDLLIEGLDESVSTLAATTLTVIRQADSPTFTPTSTFVDGTYGLRQSGDVRLRLPPKVKPTAVNGQASYWIRARIKSGDYGKEAAYQLANPLKPSEGFILMPATFRPPIIEQIKLGYEQTLSDKPEKCLTYNNLVFQDQTEVLEENGSFTPFLPFPDNFPTLYLGFTLPANRLVFLNKTLSLFGHFPDLDYGQKSIPISPISSRASQQSEVPDAVSGGFYVPHRFELIGTSLLSGRFKVAILGTAWPTTLRDLTEPSTGNIENGSEITLNANTVMTVEVRVTVGTGEHDHGFLKLSQIPNHQGEDYLEYTAVFETFAGQAIPADNRPELIWQYWNGADWARLTVRDDSENFTRSGLIEFLPPADFAVMQEPGFGFGLSSRYWIRVQWQRGRYSVDPRIQRLLLNTTMATQTITLRNEILGSSDGSEGQVLQAAKTPVLMGQKLEVREPEVPSTDEQAAIENEEGQDAIYQKLDATGRPEEIWVRWHEVPDFYGSKPRDRHYILNHLTGEIQFGDGRNGLIPPIGAGNLRMARYQTGGGNSGNKSVGSIVQMKTTVPFVEGVTNSEPATGGAEAETLEALRDRMPRTIRHRNRAVTFEDYEDLAKLASPAVARAKCVPLLNLQKNPLDVQNPPLYDQPQEEPKRFPKAPGEVSIIIVPSSTEAKPLPSVELVNRVEQYLKTNGVPTAKIWVVGPLYVGVSVTAEVALTSLEGASTVEQTIYEKLASFLHPLRGGLDNTGWDFGREPYKSDFYSLIESIPGVSHIRTLNVLEVEDLPGVKTTGRFLVYSGEHSISLVFERS